MSEIPREGLEGTSEGISRRSVLKRIGAGAAIAWSAPVLTSLNTPAFAQVSPGACPQWVCGDPITECSGTPADCGSTPICVCDLDVNGAPVCWNNIFCSDSPSCATNDDCPSGWSCTSNCCGTTCIPPCGTCPNGGPGSQRVGGRAGSAAGV